MKASIANTNIERQRGLTLVELVAALGVLSLVILSTGLTLVKSDQQWRDNLREFRALSALRSFVAEVQAKSNLDEDWAAHEGVGGLCLAYNGTVRTLSDVENGTISVRCWMDESSVPSDFGGPQDLNFDSDADDDLDNESLGTDLRIVPMQIVLSYGDSASLKTVTLNRLFTKTVN